MSGVLSEHVERRLARRAAAGDRAARRRLIEGNLGMVAALARRYARRWGVSLDDLLQEGALALVQAVNSYDPGREMRFSTYAAWWARQAIRRAAVAQLGPVRVPERAWRALYDGAPGEGWTDEELGAVRRALQPVASLESLVGEDGDELGELLPDHRAEDPAEVAARNDARRRLAEALAALPERQRTILSRRAGFSGAPESRTAIGESLGISRERVRQLERAALDELGERGGELGLEGLVA
ncbi:sigma-70 family RNA polymerase sigma factor [Rubrobacter taiwanensis]|jgi:RNA polymerase primary sigma factor|uniref:Sigma-70 family RNA polymerase sigma factor n=1 Tax=Rubrobacter taiwanensis TaxID=185139 RepID=A0A4R1BFC3_9ACTN|nr:sigma-70 family RNA polymerase sigma factor [Rubrobacter taiwanensis]TCJ15850.1 sigma-70 family RNA polymerase sigma factor [Rubrobacter taiwanensis]